MRWRRRVYSSLLLLILSGIGCATRQPTAIIGHIQTLSGTSTLIFLHIEKGSPAQAMGFQEGDLIMAVNGGTISGWDGFYSAIPATEQLVTLTVWRQGTIKDTQVLLSKGTIDKLGVISPKRDYVSLERLTAIIPPEQLKTLLDQVKKPDKQTH